LKFKVEDVNLFKAIFSSVTNLTDTAHFDISHNGIRIRSIDPHDFCYVDIKLSPSFFDGFSWKSKFSSDIEIGLLKHVLRTVTKDKALFLDFETKNLSLNLVNRNTTTYKLNWSEQEVFSLPEPSKIDYDAFVSIPSKDFFTIVKEASAVSREICFGIERNKLLVSANKNGFSYSKELSFANKLSQSIKIKSATKLLKSWAIIDYLNILSKIISLCGEVKLCLKEGLPLRLDLSYRGRGAFTFIIANRKLSSQENTIRVKKNRITSPILNTGKIPLISVTKFPYFLKSLNENDGVSVDDLKYSKYETVDRDYSKLADLLGLIDRKNGKISLNEEGKKFVSLINKKSRTLKPKMNSYLEKRIPEFNQLLDYLSHRPMTAADLIEKFSKNKNSSLRKKEDVLLLLGLATWCNTIDRRLGLYYFAKNN